MPARCWCGVPVAVTEPIDQAVEPPGDRILLEQKNAGARRPRLNRGRQTRTAAADDNHIGVVHDQNPNALSRAALSGTSVSGAVEMISSMQRPVWPTRASIAGMAAKGTVPCPTGS